MAFSARVAHRTAARIANICRRRYHLIQKPRFHAASISPEMSRHLRLQSCAIANATSHFQRIKSSGNLLGFAPRKSSIDYSRFRKRNTPVFFFFFLRQEKSNSIVISNCIIDPFSRDKIQGQYPSYRNRVYIRDWKFITLLSRQKLMYTTISFIYTSLKSKYDSWIVNMNVILSRGNIVARFGFQRKICTVTIV